MAISNTIQLITKYSTKAWDKVYKAEAMSSLLDGNENNVQWTGAKTVKIAKFNAGGLGNYYRNNDGDPRAPLGSHFGYQESNVGLVWEEFTVKQDRASRYPVELFDNEETDGLVLGAATTEISRTIMIPEIDAYCFSTVAKIIEDGAGVTGGNYRTTAIGEDANASFNALNDALVYLEEHEVPAESQVIFVSPRFNNLLRKDSTAISRLLQNDEQKKVKFRIESYEGRDLVTVPPARFKTHIDLSTTGVHWAKDSKDINFMVVSKDAVMHVVKYNKVKIIGGDANLAGNGFDGWTIFARVYHDVFIQDNKRYGVYVSVNGTDERNLISKVAPALFVAVNEGQNIIAIENYPADKKYSYGISTSGVTVGQKISTIDSGEFAAAKVGTHISATSNVFAYEGDKVVAVKNITIPLAKGK